MWNLHSNGVMKYKDICSLSKGNVGYEKEIKKDKGDRTSLVSLGVHTYVDLCACVADVGGRWLFHPGISMTR